MAPGNNIAHIVFKRFNLSINKYVGINPPPKNIIITYKVFINFLPTNLSFDKDMLPYVTATEITAYEIE